jgi:DNA-binding response OmpR family regulator
LASPTVLVVEDNPAVRDIVALMLKQAGYVVLAARDGDDALAVAEAVHVPIDLLLCDVILPGPTVQAVIANLRRLSPAVHILLMSGYPTDQLDTAVQGVDAAEILAKPFTSAQLLERVRRALRVPPD